MAETEKSSEPAALTPPVEGVPPTPPKRSPGHRGADVKDTVAEMAAKAHEISLEAGSKMAAAMKDVVNAAAGLTGFVIESARDLVQYMVRRGQMTQEEADKLIRQVEEHQPKRKHIAPPAPLKPSPPAHASAPAPATAPSHTPVTHAAPVKATTKPPAKASKPAAKAKSAKPVKSTKSAKSPKSAAKKPAKPVARKAPPKKSPAKKPAPKKAAKAKRK